MPGCVKGHVLDKRTTSIEEAALPGLYDMTDMTHSQGTPAWKRYAPLIAIGAVALIGAVTLRDYLSFETLAANRDALEAFRDANYLLTAGAFMLAYVVIVGFSLPGATIATLTGGFLFGVFPGALFNVLAAAVGATVIFLAARYGLGRCCECALRGDPGERLRVRPA